MASSADGTKLIAAAYDRGIYTSADSGTTWTSNNVAGTQFGTWISVSSSADGATLFAARYFNYVLFCSTNSGALWVPTEIEFIRLVKVEVKIRAGEHWRDPKIAIRHRAGAANNQARERRAQSCGSHAPNYDRVHLKG